MQTSSHKDATKASFNFLFLSSNGKKLKNAHPYLPLPQTPNKAKFFIQPSRQTEKEISSQDFINNQYAVLCKLCYYLSPTFCLFQVEKYICFFVFYQPPANYLAIVHTDVVLCSFCCCWLIGVISGCVLFFLPSPWLADAHTSYCAKAESYYQFCCESWRGANLVTSMLVLEFCSVCTHYCTINTTIISRAPGIHSDSDIARLAIHYKRTHFLVVLSCERSS